MFMKGRLGYDDSPDAFGVHGVGGMLKLERGGRHHPRSPPRQVLRIRMGETGVSAVR